ncbi:hypothetical protein ABIE44_001349 [Marmoricola sp. OAE513]|uniref:hypothetical protein n=1 Tax=Marmoricola sp. OAE513 TaxID=2817894 RepID=UPI001AE41686
MMETMDDSAPSDTDPFPRVQVPPAWRGPVLCLLLALLVVVVAWLFGHLPWVLDGFREDDAGGVAEGRVVIPLFAGELSALVAYTAVGTIAATVLPAFFSGLPRGVAVTLTVLVVAVTTLVLTMTARSAVAGRALDGFDTDDRVLDGLVVGVFAVTAACVVLGALSSLQPGFTPVAAAVVVTQLPSWFAELGWQSAAVRDVTTAVLLAAALVISVRRSPWWAVLWPLALVIVWSGTPFTAGLLAVQTRLRAGQNVDEQLGDIVANGFDVFGAAYWDASRTWWPWVVAFAAGAVWLVVRHRSRRRPR